MKSEYVSQYETLERKHWWWVARRRILLSTLAGLSSSNDPSRKASLLDIGCGAGLNLAALPGRFQRTGLEPDPTLAEAARVNSGSEIYVGKLGECPPLHGRRFHIILLLDVLEHIEDDLGALKEAARMLADGGKLIINVPAMPFLWSVHDVVNEHKRRYVSSGLRDLIKGAGLHIDRVRYWGGSLVPFAYAVRMLTSSDPENYRVAVPSGPVNRVLQGLAVSEFHLSSVLPTPFGLSLLAVASKARA